MPFCGWLVSVSNLRSQYQSWLGRSPCSLHHALWLRPLARKSSILSAHNSRSSCLASLVTRISSFPLMTSLSHQRRGARRYGWFDAYEAHSCRWGECFTRQHTPVPTAPFSEQVLFHYGCPHLG